jgi:hypothetical protein
VTYDFVVFDGDPSSQGVGRNNERQEIVRHIDRIAIVRTHLFGQSSTGREISLGSGSHFHVPTISQPRCGLIAFVSDTQRLGQAAMAGSAFSSLIILASHFASTLARRQYNNAASQVSTNAPTITKPAVLMLKFWKKLKKGSFMPDC